MSEEKLQPPCKECEHYKAEPTRPIAEGKCYISGDPPALVMFGTTQMKADEGCFKEKTP